MKTRKPMTVEGTWYAPYQKLLNLQNTLAVEFIEQSSSAGDWSGLLFTQVTKGIQVTFWNQENNFPRNGFTIYFDKPWAVFPLIFNKETKKHITKVFIEKYYPLCKEETITRKSDGEKVKIRRKKA